MYDWANSAFATTVLAAVLPVYYSQVAGRSLGSAAQATAYWTATLILLDDSVTGRPPPGFFDTLTAAGEGDYAVDSDAVLDDGEPMVIDGYNAAVHEGVEIDVTARRPGEHLLVIVNTADADPASTGTVMAIGESTVLPPPRSSELTTILAVLAVVEILGLALASALGGPLFRGLAETMTTKRTIILALVAYSTIAVWGFLLDSVIEFWFLAFMVAVVQGGSQGLSRSLYASMSPTALSGEFFGFFSVMSKFSAIVGPLLFTGAVFVFGSSRPAVLGLIVFFVVGIIILSKVDEEQGRQAAKDADAAAAAAGIIESG